MPAPPFFLTLSLSGADPSSGLIHDVAASALERLGYADQSRASLLRELDAELQQAARRGVAACEIRFQVEAGSLVIVVTPAGGQEARLARPLPAD